MKETRKIMYWNDMWRLNAPCGKWHKGYVISTNGAIAKFAEQINGHVEVYSVRISTLLSSREASNYIAGLVI